MNWTVERFVPAKDPEKIKRCEIHNGIHGNWRTEGYYADMLSAMRGARRCLMAEQDGITSVDDAIKRLEEIDKAFESCILK